LSEMRKPITVAAVIGFNVGMYWSFAGQSGFRWGCIMRVSCPPMVAVHGPWWLVALLNAALYAVTAVVVGLLLRLVRPFVR
jgi:hypothetical protein